MEDRTMRDLTNAVWIELRKATRSRMPLFTALGFLVLPCGLAFFMFIYKYRSEEHTSELQSHLNLVCRLLLEKKKKCMHCRVTWISVGLCCARKTVLEDKPSQTYRLAILLAWAGTEVLLVRFGTGDRLDHGE